MYYPDAVNSDIATNCYDDTTDSMGNPDNFKIDMKKLLKKINPIAGIATIAAGGALSKKILRKPVLGVAGVLKTGPKLLKKVPQSNVNTAINNILNNPTATDTNMNESLSTPAGQIGSEAGQTVAPAASALGLSGGGGGDVGGDTMQDVESTGSARPSEGDPNNPTELAGVTVTAKKPNWLLIGAIMVIAIFLIIYIAKRSKTKKK